MTPTQELWDRVLSLPADERAALAHRLLLSLEPDEGETHGDAEWEAEFQARLDAVEQGRFQARDWHEALADMRKNISQGPAS